MNSHFKKEINQYDDRFEKDIAENRKQSKVDVHENMRKINEEHQKERDAIVFSNEEKMRTLKHDNTEMRKSYGHMLKDSERKLDATNERWAQKLRDTIENDSEKYADDIKVRKQILDTARMEVRDKFDKIISKKTADMDQVQEQFEDSVNKRFKFADWFS